MNKGALVVVVVASALALVGCTSTPPDPTSRPHTASPSASPSAIAPTKPALADLVLTPHGIGDIRLGRPVPADGPAVAIALWDPSACVSAGGLSLGDPYAGLWRANYPDVTSGASAFILVTDGGTQGGAVDYIGVRDASAVHTATGVTVGSTLEALKAAYPGGFTQTTHGENGADVYAVGGATGVIAFDVSVPYPDDPSGWPAGDLNKVIAMNVYVPRSDVPIQPNFGTTNSGFCPD